jgi:membrane protein required for colicin V production
VAITFTVLFLATMAFFLVLGFLLSRFVKLLFLGGFNRLIGGLFGLSQGVLLLAVVVFALSLRPLPWGMDKTMKEAYLAQPFVELGGAVMEGSQRILK